MEMRFNWRTYVKDMADICDSFEEFTSFVNDSNLWVINSEGMTMEEISEKYGYAISEDWCE